MKRISLMILVIILVGGCAGIPVRKAVKVDMTVPVGRIEGNQFTGIRYPFKVSAPAGWEMATEYPKFMLDLGYEEEGLKESEVFIFNAATQSNLQIDFVPAGRYARFNQKTIERLTNIGAGSFREESEKEDGERMQAEVSTTQPYSLKGVPYAAKNFATFSRNGVKTEQGWIYGFAEPYQIFILYMILEKEGTNDRQDIKTILDSFQVLSKPKKNDH